MTVRAFRIIEAARPQAGPVPAMLPAPAMAGAGSIVAP
jgi:hypothetical protein